MNSEEVQICEKRYLCKYKGWGDHNGPSSVRSQN